MTIRASAEDPTVNNNDTAFKSGVEPSFKRSNIAIVNGASDPTSIKVVLKFSKLMRNATTIAPTNAGIKNGMVTVLMAVNGVAPRFKAASSKLRSNFCKRAEITNVAIVAMNENCPKITKTNPGRRTSRSIFAMSHRPFATDE